MGRFRPWGFVSVVLSALLVLPAAAAQAPELDAGGVKVNVSALPQPSRLGFEPVPVPEPGPTGCISVPTSRLDPRIDVGCVVRASLTITCGLVRCLYLAERDL